MISQVRALRVRTKAAVALCLVTAAAHFAAAGPVAEAAQAPPTPPNIILITVDDATSYDLEWMPFTRELLGGEGVTFTQALSPHPLCCPARAEIITGQYAQNNGVKHNDGPHGGYPALLDRNNTIGRWLHDGGYQTAMVGKYLNAYRHVLDHPEGWDHWNPFVDGTTFTRTRYYNDGVLTVRDGYVDDITNDYAIDYIDEFSGPDPFFVWVSNYAPHRVMGNPAWGRYPIPADRFRDVLLDVRLPALSKTSFNEKNVSDQPPITDKEMVNPADMQKNFTYRIQSMQAADEGVKRIVEALEANGELDNTYLLFTSDNGYLLGEHRLTQKNYLFKEALKVPFVVRVPGATAATSSRMPITMVDLAPTIAELAGVEPQRPQDGTSFAPLLANGTMPWRDTQLIQTGRTFSSRDGWWMRGVRTDRFTYGKDLGTGFEQLYDRKLSPSETKNVATDPRYRPVLVELRRRLNALRNCSGVACSTSFGAVPDPLL